MHPLETYLSALYDARLGGGVAETSGYAALANLLNEVGGGLKPKTRCILHPHKQGAGIPDGGLYTLDQLERKGAKAGGAVGRGAVGEPKPNQVPARGVIEVKSTGEEVATVAAGDQVLRYLERYRRVLVTNYRDFVLVGYDAAGRPAQLETYSLAANEAEFWAQALHPRTMARVHGDPPDRVPQAGHAERRAPGGARGRGLVPGLLRSGRQGPHRGVRPARPHGGARGAGGGPGHPLRGRER
ncbi:MAG: hypothetical protein M5U22_20345 [Thermoleophilia bacterium]|nr:hypothetical protein [Thermoleophilia bacterium]